MNNIKKNVLFIATKNLDYLRNTQEINMLREKYGDIEVIGSEDKSYVRRLIHIYSKLVFLKTRCYDMIFIGFAPQLILIPFGWKFKHSKVIIDFFVSVYDTMIYDRKKWGEKGIMAKICKWVDKKTIARADKIISDTNTHGDYFAEEFGISRKKIKTLYLQADKSIYYPRKVEKPEEWKNKFVVLYFGSILPLQGIEIILNAVRYLELEKSIQFVIIGPIRQEVLKPQRENVAYIDWLNQEELAKYISYADLCLAGHFNDKINKAKRTIPGKAYIYREMEKSVILGDSKATRELYNEKDTGIYFVEMGNARLLADKIVECKEDWKGKSARRK